MRGKSTIAALLLTAGGAFAPSVQAAGVEDLLDLMQMTCELA